MKLPEFNSNAVRYGVAAVLAVLAFLIMVFAAPAHAESAIYTNGGVTVELSSGMCKNSDMADTLRTSANGKAIEVKAATVTVYGAVTVGCWYREGEKVILLDEAGRAGYILYSEFVRKGI